MMLLSQGLSRGTLGLILLSVTGASVLEASASGRWSVLGMLVASCAVLTGAVMLSTSVTRGMRMRWRVIAAAVSLVATASLAATTVRFSLVGPAVGSLALLFLLLGSSAVLAFTRPSESVSSVPLWLSGALALATSAVVLSSGSLTWNSVSAKSAAIGTMVFEVWVAVLVPSLAVWLLVGHACRRSDQSDQGGSRLSA